MLIEISAAVVIVFVCLLLHVAGIMIMAEWLLGHRHYFERSCLRINSSFLIIVLFSGIMVLHIIETSLWAAFYYAGGLFQTFETALYFSLVSFTSIGYGDVLLPPKWRLLGAIEGVSGVLLCGISTAFMFAIINAIFKMRFKELPRPTILSELTVTPHRHSR